MKRGKIFSSILKLTIVFMLYIPILIFAKNKDNDHPKRIIAYFTSWGDRNDKGNYGVDDIPWDKLTHINYAFAGVGKNYKISLLDTVTSILKEYAGQDPSLPYLGQFNLFTVYKRTYPDVKTLISIGGWAASGGFYEMLSSEPNREIFANSCIKFIRDYGFDGLDIDFEYPSSAEGCVHPLDDLLWMVQYKDVIYSNYLAMINLLREKIDIASSEDNKKYLLSIAASASSWTLSGMDMGQYCQQLDYINIMTYDLHGAWNKFVGPQSELYASENDPETSMLDQPTLNIDWAVKYYSGYMHPSQINIGIPYYSRGWKDVSGGTNGLWGTTEEITHTFVYNYEGETYTMNRVVGVGAGGIDGIWNDPTPEPLAGANPIWHVKNLLLNPGTQEYNYLSETSLAGPQSNISGYTNYFDNETKSSWVWNNDKKIFLTYENTESLEQKLAYIVDRGLGGMMFWELSGDYKYDAEKGYYVAGNDMTTFAYNYFNDAIIKDPVEVIMPDDSLAFDYSYSCTISHPNVTPVFKIFNLSEEEIPGGWVLEFYMPKSARYETTWGTGELSVIDESHPFWTKYRIVGPQYQSIPVGGSITISGNIKLYCSKGPVCLTLNGKTSTFETHNSSINDDIVTPQDISLSQNYPNPFNPSTIIEFKFGSTNFEFAKIVVYNSLGEIIWSSNPLTKNTNYCNFDGAKFNSGIYYYTLIVDGKKISTKKMIMIK